MADRAQPVSRALVAAGTGAAAIIAALVLLPVAAVLFRVEDFSGLRTADWAAIRFTLWQAFLSAAISVALAIPVARALARQSFPGRGLMLSLMGAPFILPVLVAVFGLIAVFGQTGLVNTMLGTIGLEPVRIYGLQGVVLAHVFLNLPLAARMFLAALQSTPSERYRLAENLSFGSGATWVLVDWPAIRRALPGAFLVIFLICLTSFAVALTMGGGPRATTIELAIYQAFRFDFDLARASNLAIVQLILSVAAVAVALTLTLPHSFGRGLDRSLPRWDGASGPARIADALVLLAASAFLLLPIGFAILPGADGLMSLPASVWEAAARSLGVAVAAAGLSVVFALAIALAARGRPMVEAVGYLAITSSPMVVGTGLFLLIFPVADPALLALPVVVLVNAVFATPFAVRILVPAAEAAEIQFGRLADQLDFGEWARLMWLLLPRMRREIGFAAGLSAALSMGDLGVVTLFAAPDAGTLPLQMYRLMASYRTEDAAAAAFLLVALTFGLFFLFDLMGRYRADT